MRLLALAGSTRDGSLNAALLAVILDELAGDGFDIDRVDYALFEDTPQYSARREATDGVPPAMRALARRITDATAQVWVTPEYNHGIPGSMKNGIDWLSRISPGLMALKPTLIAGASAAPYGAWRAMRALRPALELMGALTLPYMISVGGVRGEADIRARFADPEARAKIDAALAALRHQARLARPQPGG
ncbi:MAG: NAD(P)H-dependent oxidoreductase [Paracoccaceae bacterium]|nr:MAG: NAD(P)H-dependent oxidoreductase [Paracoccaceae bacterium]